jgi:hypothetical protein
LQTRVGFPYEVGGSSQATALQHFGIAVEGQRGSSVGDLDRRAERQDSAQGRDRVVGEADTTVADVLAD